MVDSTVVTLHICGHWTHMIGGGFFFILDPKLVDPEFDDPEKCCFHEFSTFPCFLDECRNTDPEWYLEQDALWAADESIENMRPDYDMCYRAKYYDDLVLREIYNCSKANFQQQEILLQHVASFDTMLEGILYNRNYFQAIKYLSRFAARAIVWLGRAEVFWNEGRKTFYEGCVGVARILLTMQHEDIENLIVALEETDRWFKKYKIVDEWMENIPQDTNIDDINSPPIMRVDAVEHFGMMGNADEWDSVSLRKQPQPEE